MDPCIVRALLFLCLCFCGFPKIQGKHANIKLKDGHRKQLGACVFPERLPVTIYIEDMTLDINLLVNHELSAQIPVYIMTERGGLSQENLESHPPHRAYKDKEKMAAIVISCIKNNPRKNFILEGRITHNERVYTISPHPDPSRHPRDTNQGHSEYILTIPDIYESTDSSFMDSNSEALHRNKRESHEQQREVIHREKRAFESAKYIIDIMIITDYTIYNNFYNQALNPFLVQKRFETIGNIRKYYVAAFNWVNLIYENFPSFDFNIKINVAAIVISENATTSPWTEPVRVGNRVYGMKTLDKMTEWIENNTGVYPEYDHVQLFSRFDFTDDEAHKTTGNKGKSYIGSTCTGSRSISYVEELGAFNSADIAAHELGHSFGAHHDGFGNVCPIQSSDLMAVVFNPRIARSNKPSICTLRDIKRYMEGMHDYTPECLYNPMPIMSDVPTSTIFPGMEFGVDQQCRQVYGKDSFHCRNAVVEDMNDFCYEDLFCYDPEGGSCSSIVPALGTPCGNKSWCIDTECRYDDRAPERDASCLFGDLPHGYFQLTQSGESCAQRVISQPSDCYDDFFSAMCCESCTRVRNDKNKDCPFGDSHQPCFTFKCGSDIIIDDTEYVYNDICCDTCATTTTVPTTTTTEVTTTVPTTTTTEITTTAPTTTTMEVTTTVLTTTTPEDTTTVPTTTTTEVVTTVPTTSPTVITTSIPSTSTTIVTTTTTSTTTTPSTSTSVFTSSTTHSSTSTDHIDNHITTGTTSTNSTGHCAGRQEYPVECQTMIQYGGDCRDFQDVCCETCKNNIAGTGTGSASATLEFSLKTILVVALVASWC